MNKDMAKIAVKQINHRIFAYLISHPTLWVRDTKRCIHPGKVIKYHLLGELRLTRATLYSTGAELSYYFSMRRKPRSEQYLRNGISRFMNGDASKQSLAHLQLINIVQIASNLSVPLEYILYGKTDKLAVAKYNYHHYDELKKFHRSYLHLQMGFHRTIARLIKRLYTTEHSYSKIARQMGMSRQNVYEYAHGDNTLLRKRSSYDKLCKLASKNALDTMTYPLLSKSRMTILGRQFSKYYHERFDKK